MMCFALLRGSPKLLENWAINFKGTRVEGEKPVRQERVLTWAQLNQSE